MRTAVRQLMFSIADSNIHYIDLAQCLSQVNRRGYSQEYVYYVESFAWRPNVPLHDIDVISLPTSWTVYNSWVKAKALWNKMNRLYPPVAKPKFHDFKVFFDAPHYLATGANSFTSNLMPKDGESADFSVIGAEWVYSQFVSASSGGAGPALQNCCHMLGDDSATNNVALVSTGSHAIIQGYGDTRVTLHQQDPDLPEDASSSWMTDLFDDGETTSDIVEHLEDFNDSPPYAIAIDPAGGDNPIYVGGSESGDGGHQLALIAPQGTETAYAAGGEVPCGLLKVQAAGEGVFFINVAPGDVDGVAALRMGKVPT